MIKKDTKKNERERIWRGEEENGERERERGTGGVHGFPRVQVASFPVFKGRSVQLFNEVVPLVISKTSNVFFLFYIL